MQIFCGDIRAHSIILFLSYKKEAEAKVESILVSD